MIRFKFLTLKNFMSVGNTIQTVSFTNCDLTLILGKNLDLGGEGSTNGTGKTTILNALSFALYGQPLSSIRKDNLINTTNQKNLVVSLDYEVDGSSYRIERGRKPNFLRFYVNDGLVNSPDSDESAGESKWTQSEISRTLGDMSHTLFKHIVALHTKTIPFLSQKEKEQREIIEELLGITQLSRKAESLKDQIKQVKDEMRDEEIRIKTVIDSNEKVQRHINDLKFKSGIWERESNKKIIKFHEDIKQLDNIDIEQEIEAHRTYEKWHILNEECLKLHTEFESYDDRIVRIDRNREQISKQFASLDKNLCPTCGQTIHTQHANIHSDLEAKDNELSTERKNADEKISSLVVLLEEKLTGLSKLGDEPVRLYKTLEQALNHRHTIDRLNSDLQRELAIENPYIEQIANLSTSVVQDISYDYLNELMRLKEHQDFLYKLLTSKESFIRKKIIDQNLSYLNFRLNHYLNKLQLPHEVVFQNDLSVEISNVGKEYDFDQLSNGEANRLVLALAWAFRDVWESLNNYVNLLAIDEVVDTGLDPQGTDASLELLKQMARERHKNIFLISHKDGLETRVDQVLLVEKENNFTSFLDPSMDN